MRIAQVAPLFESVPPQLYGGTERVVFNLTEALVALGHRVTLFASGDSLTSGHLIPTGRRALRMSGAKEPIAAHVAMFEKVRRHASEFDVIHFHNEYLHLGFSRELRTPHLTTFHGRLDHEEYAELFREFSFHPAVSISFSQRTPQPTLNWIGNVYHGLRSDHLPYSPKPEGYLAFLGRVSPEKGLERAIEIARRAGRRLKVAAKIENFSDPYVQALRPLLQEPFVEFVGEIADGDKGAFLGGAEALLFPIEWPEPFGLAMIEALAVGTPVIAFDRGSVPEVIRNAITGFIVDSIDEAVEAVDRLDEIRRENCRSDFIDRFSVERMAKDYVAIYERFVDDRRKTEVGPLDGRLDQAFLNLYPSGGLS